MINIHANIRSDEWEKFSALNFENNPDVVFNMNSSFFAFRYNWQIKTGSTTAFVGYCHNASKREDDGLYSFKLEYNPNKVVLNDVDVLGKILSFLFARKDLPLENVRVKSVDVAYDLEHPISAFIVDKGLKRDMRFFKGTMYFGEATNGVKIYDKQKEFKEKQGIELDNPLTRYEMRMVLDAKIDMLLNNINLCPYLDVLLAGMPTLYLYGNDLFLDSKDRAIILGLREEPCLINSFSYRSKIKYKKILEEYGSFHPSSKSVNQCICQYIKDLHSLICASFVYSLT